MTGAYTTFEVAVSGGALHVGRWGDGERLLLAAHGITGTHRSYLALANALPPDTSLVAPDLRGRGKSNGVTGPCGMAAHADDLALVLDHLHAEQATVIGHSMGGSVAVVLADRHPDRVDRLVLVDGGPPIIRERPTGTVEEIVRDAIGPALDRLDMTFPSVPAYLDFWRAHPAWADWTSYAEDAFTYDLVGQPPSLRSGVDKAAVVDDGGSLLVSDDVPTAIANLRHQATLLYAPRGMLDQVPGMFPPDVVDGWVAQLPTLTAAAVPDVNHYTILMSDRGAAAIAAVIETGRPPQD